MAVHLRCCGRLARKSLHDEGVRDFGDLGCAEWCLFPRGGLASVSWVLCRVGEYIEHWCWLDHRQDQVDRWIFKSWMHQRACLEAGGEREISIIISESSDRKPIDPLRIESRKSARWLANFQTYIWLSESSFKDLRIVKSSISHGVARYPVFEVCMPQRACLETGGEIEIAIIISESSLKHQIAS